MSRIALDGSPGSAGTGVGRLRWVAPVQTRRSAPLAVHDSSRIATETERLNIALAAAATELEALASTTAARVGESVGAIFEAQALFARDPGIVRPATERIEAGSDAAEAIELAAAEQADILAAIDDPYFRERASDVRDVARRVVDHLEGRSRPELHHPDGTLAIIAGDDLEPSVVVALRPELVGGIALVRGASTGHAAIVARALGIPLVLGVGPALNATLDGHAAALDGTAGRLIVDPTDADRASLVGLTAAASTPRSRAPESPRSKEPTWCPIEANVGSLREAEAAAAAGADGIGLVRTELLFLGRAVPPGLGEQRALYRGIAAAMPGRPVTFRSLDIGGDKPADYASDADDSSALGVRGIRLGLRRPELLETQLRALLEASPDLPLRILLPMVGTLEEVAAAREALDRAAAASRAANAPIASDVRLGVMIEVPSAALLADAFAGAVDFLSIGTNDLVQYTLAADRTNQALTDLASPLQPAVLRLIASVVRAADAAGCPVSVCGEAAGDPLAGPILVGLGVRRLSVAPQSIGTVRLRLASVGLAACRAAAEAALEATTLAAVRELAASRLPQS
jgi:multiphosphoryl transfer protein